MGIYATQHPLGALDRHPWNNPLAPQDFRDPRPDTELAILGGGGPRPEDFPFNDRGRSEYYAAVRAETHALQAQRQQIAIARQAKEEAAARRAAFLLLS